MENNNNLKENSNLFFDALKNQKDLLLNGMTRLNSKIEKLGEQVDTIKSIETSPKYHSDDLIELAIALAKAQSEIEIAGKNSSGYNFKYADLTEIIRASRPSLSKNGLSVLQPIITNKLNNKTSLETILLHVSGQWVKSSMEIPDIQTGGKTPVQAFGATVSYLRRYCYASLIGVVASKEEDLDSES